MKMLRCARHTIRLRQGIIDQIRAERTWRLALCEESKEGDFVLTGRKLFATASGGS